MKSYDDVMAMGKENMEAAVAASTKVSKGVEELSKECFAIANRSMDQATKNVKEIATVKTPQELLSVQTRIAQESWEVMIGDMKKVSEMTAAIAKDAFEPMTNQVKAVMEQVGKAA